MLNHFYDIESLKNVFTLCNFKPEENHIDVYILADTENLRLAMKQPQFHSDLLQVIHEKNKNFNGSISIYDLHYHTDVSHLAMHFGLSNAQLVNDPNAYSAYPAVFRPVCDTDPDFDENKHPYLWGYNSYNYDTTMLSLFFFESIRIEEMFIESDYVENAVFKATTAETMVNHNNNLFLSEFKGSMPTYLTSELLPARGVWTKPDYQDIRWKIRKNMLLTGRHLDVARLNEKLQKVGLKRLLGMLGFQILESEKLSKNMSDTTIENVEQLFDLLAYNVSDIVNLKELFDTRYIQGQVRVKKGLLEQYPELVYSKMEKEYKPDIRPEKVRRDRLTIDSSSAQLATKALSPYGNLPDIPFVSFMYPSEAKSKELGIPRVNVLEEARKFFYENFPQPELRAQFDVIYNYYKNIEGKNFNESTSYTKFHSGNKAYSFKDLPVVNTNLPYFDANGKPTSCFVTFSTGGIHGAEFNVELFEHHMKVYNQTVDEMSYVQSIYPDPIELKKAKTVEVNGVKRKATDFLKAGSTLKAASYKDLSKNKPCLFKADAKGKTTLNNKYTFTSADPVSHSDFESYYPNMLRMMDAFFNPGLGYDRYAEIFANKQLYGKLMKDKSLSKEDRDSYDIMRDGTKLILNSASGAADATFESNIRMNNNIISMRIIGQLFSWRIGQALAIGGGRITSTNTDGLFTALEPTINDEILFREREAIGVAIEPELTYLITKDSNNRIELDPVTGKIERASGGTLACHQGPNLSKSLDHPAIIDWALCEYLILAALNYKGQVSMSSDFNREIGLNILKSASTKFDQFKLMNMFQNVLASSTGSVTYIFGQTTNDKSPIIMQHYNRVFILKDGTENTVHLQQACARKITDSTAKKRQRNNERPQQHNPLALDILKAHGVTADSIGFDKEASLKKITNIETEWFMFIQNKDLRFLTDEETSFIIDNLDYDKYLTLLENCFEANWRNKTGGVDLGDDPVDDEAA